MTTSRRTTLAEVGRPIGALARYGAALAAWAVATAVTLSLAPYLTHVVFVFYWPAVLFAAWYAGTRPALVVSVLSVATVDYFIIEPRGGFIPTRPSDYVSLALFAGLSLVVSALAGRLTAAREHGKAASREAAAAREQLAAIVRSSEDAVIGKALDGTITSWNDAAARLFGHRAEAMTGRSILTLIPPELHDEERRILARLAAGEHVAHYETARVARDGRRIDVSLSVAPIRDDTGRVVGASAIVRDVGDRKRAEQRLARVTALLEEAERSAHLGSWEWSIASNEVTWSDEMYRVYGLVPGEAEITFDTFLAHVHPDDRALVRGEIERAFAARGAFSLDHRIVRRDGETRTLHAEGRVVAGPDGAPERMVGSGHDITERHRAELRERAAREEAEAANRAKSDFLATMSHELRTPLNAIAGYVQLLEMGLRGPITPEQRADLERIRRNQRHLLGLIDDLLGFARIEAGRVEFDLQPVPVAATLAGLSALVEPQLRAKSLHYAFDPPPPGLVACADPDKLQQILLNLVSNAIKFTPPGGRIDVTGRAAGGAVEILVRDSGRGIPADRTEAIFEPFVQLESGTKRTAEGTGLGLSISRTLARGMRGDIAVESAPGEGSTFTLRLPAANGAAPAA